MSLHFHQAVFDHYPGLAERITALSEVVAELRATQGPVLALLSRSDDELVRIDAVRAALVADFRGRICAAARALGEGGNPAEYERAVLGAINIAICNALTVGVWTGQEGLCELPDPRAAR